MVRSITGLFIFGRYFVLNEFEDRVSLWQCWVVVAMVEATGNSALRPKQRQRRYALPPLFSSALTRNNWRFSIPDWFSSRNPGKSGTEGLAAEAP